MRTGLGCGCPAEVFEDIRIEPRPESFAGLPVDTLVRIGGRLLVAVCAGSRWGDVADRLATLVETGKELRDREGYNRFRLVVACDDAKTAAPVFEDRFGRLKNPDERLHVHVIEPSALPHGLA